MAGHKGNKTADMGNANEKERDPEKDTVVEKILARRVIDGKVEYLLKWEGCGEKWNSWEPIEILGKLKEWIDDFDQEQEEKKKMAARSRVMKRASSGSSSGSGDSKCGGDGGSNSGKRIRAERKPIPHTQGSSTELGNGIERRPSNGDKSPSPPPSLKCNAEGCGRRFDCQAMLSFHKRKAHQVYYSCRVCMLNPKAEKNLKLSSKEDAKAHFAKFHKGMRWEPFTDECLPTPTSTPNGSPEASPVKPESPINKPSGVNNSLPKTEVEWLRTLIIDKDKRIAVLQTQLTHAADDNGILQKKLNEKDGELEASREQIESLGKTILKKDESIALLQSEGVQLTEKNIDLEFKLEQLQMETEAKTAEEVKVVCECKEKITELEVKVAQLEGEREQHQDKDSKLEAKNVKLTKEVDELRKKLVDAETDRQLFDELVNVKEGQLEYSMNQIQTLEEELKNVKGDRDKRMEFLEFEVDRLKRLNNERVQHPLHIAPEEIQFGNGFSDPNELEKKVLELEKALEEARYQLEDAREDCMDGKSKLKAVTIMWEMELEKVQKELDAQRNITTTID